jgi:hypothetical protein
MMMVERQFLLIWALMVVILACPESARAQRLYDGSRDKEAQKAQQLADEITSRSNFDKQLQNLDTLSKHDFDVYFAGAKRQMDLDLRTFRTWEAVGSLTDRVKQTINTADFIPKSTADAIVADLQVDCATGRATDLGKAVCTAQEELKKMNTAVKASEAEGKALEEELKSRLEKIGAVETLVNEAESFLKSNSKANLTIKGLSGVFINIANSYVNYVNKLATIKTQPKDELRLLLQRIAVESLQVEVDHWNRVGEIQLRRASEETDLQFLVKDVEFRLTQISKCLSVDMPTLKAERINATFSRALALPKCGIVDPEDSKKELELPKDEIVAYLYQTLHSAAALAARGETPMKLAELRLAQEEHRFSIRHSAVIARSYEVALGSGTKRLARFYAGGIKPEKIAQLIYSAATVAIPTVIAIK